MNKIICSILKFDSIVKNIYKRFETIEHSTLNADHFLKLENIIIAVSLVIIAIAGAL